MKNWKTVLILFGFGLASVLVLRYKQETAAAPVPEYVPKSGAMKTLGNWALQRSYPGENFPSEGYFQGYVHSNMVLKKVAARLQAEDTWETMGPSTYGGRTNALLVDPNNSNVLYAGTATGGLWRMTMSGSTYSWEYVDTRFPVLGVNAIAIPAQDSKTIYIGTGEVYGYQKSTGSVYTRLTRGSYGIGILKSEDGGATWQKSLDWSYEQQRGVLCLRINPLNPQVVFAGTSEGVFKSTDAGATWEQVHNVLMAVDIAFHPADTSMIYVACGNLGSQGTGIYRSFQGGTTGSFYKLGNGLPQSWDGKTILEVCPDNPDALYADIGNDTGTVGLYFSPDQGTTWTLRTDQDYASYQGWFSHYVRANPEDCDQLMIGGTHYYRSTDGGRSLTMVGGQWPNNTLHLDHHTSANHPTEVNTVFIGHDGGVSRTTDGGQTFEYMNDGYISTQFYPGFSSSLTDSGFAIGGLQDNQILVYRGAGTDDWTLYTTGDGTYTAIDPNDNNVFYIGNQHLWVTRTLDGGQNWNYIAHGIQSKDSAAFVAPFVMAPSEPTILYAGGAKVFRTANRGDSWTAMNGGKALNGSNILAMGISHTNSDVLYVTVGPSGGNRSEIYKTSDGGGTFSNITGNLPDRFYPDIVVSPLDDQVIYLTLSGFGTSHLYYSEYGNGDWTDIGQGLPDVPTSAVMLDPDNPDHLYVGNDLGVYVSLNHGQTWHTWSEDLPTAVMVYDLNHSPSNNKIRAITHGNGVYQRSLLPAGAVKTQPAMNSPGYRLLHQGTSKGVNIQCFLERQEFVSLRVFDLQGKVIKSWPVRKYPAGEFSLLWEGRDNRNNAVPNGSYLVSMRAGNVHTSASVQLLR